jgi:hypothetical protein
MKREFVNTLISGLALAVLAVAEEKVTVPISNPSQPVTVKAHLISGSIIVTTGPSNQVTVDSAANDQPAGLGDNVRAQVDRALRDAGVHSGRNEPIPPGMHRIDAGARSFTVEEDRNVVTVMTDARNRNSNLVLQVPVNTSVELKTINGGHIDVTGINGDIDVENTNGSITLKNVSGAVSAHTMNGEIVASVDRVTANKPMSFTSFNGRVDVTLPGDTKARFRLKTTNGEVYSDFDVKMEPDNSNPVVEDSRGKGGKYRIRMDRSVTGTINGGGPEYVFQTMNGTILIHKK